MVAQLVWDQWAAGSNPATPTIFSFCGEVSEWFKELVLKTSDSERGRAFESHPLRQWNQSETKNCILCPEKYSSRLKRTVC